jgi:AAA domain
MVQGELVLIFGPPAVGKTTVGRAVCDRTDFRLFMNHHTIEPLAAIFGMDTPSFRTLTSEFRRRVVEEAATSGVRLAVTLVWNLAGVEDARWVRSLVAPYADRGLPVSFVELEADLETRLQRNRGEDRLLAKPSKRNLAWSEGHLRERESSWVMNTDPAVDVAADDVLGAHRHLRLDNRAPDPQATADQVVAWLSVN